MRPFLPPLLAGALARGDIGLDFSETDYSFLESPAFLGAVLALTVASYALDRASAGAGEERPRPPAAGLFAAAALALGALLFAGSLADGGHTTWPGLVAGVACAALAWAAASTFLARVRRRLDAGAAGLLDAYADGVALALAGLAILVPPVSFLALAVFTWLLARGRRDAARKYEGLRILR